MSNITRRLAPGTFYLHREVGEKCHTDVEICGIDGIVQDVTSDPGWTFGLVECNIEAARGILARHERARSRSHIV